MTKHDKWEKFSTQCYFSPTRTKTLDGVRHLVDKMGDSDVSIIKSAVVAPDTNVMYVPNNITGDGAIFLAPELESYTPGEISEKISRAFAISVLGYSRPNLSTEEQKEVSNKLRSWGFTEPQSASAAAHV